MRTKTALLTAALVAAGAATSMAQVYSLNVVGYINVTLTNGFQMVSCPLASGATGGNTLNNVLPAVPNGTTVYKFQSNTYVSDSFITPGPGWVGGGTLTLNPGEGAFISLPGSPGTSATVTFVGTVPQGTLSTPLSAGFQIVSSQVPLSGGVTTTLGYTPSNNDTLYTFDPATQGYASASYIAPPGPGWVPAEPTLNVAQAFFLSTAASGSWSTTFTVH